MAEKTLPVYLSLEQAAEVMSLSVKTIRRRIADDTIPAYQCGQRPYASAWKSSKPLPAVSPRPGGEHHEQRRPRRVDGLATGGPGDRRCTGR